MSCSQAGYVLVGDSHPPASCAPMELTFSRIEVNGRSRQDAVPLYRPPYQLLATRCRLTLPAAGLPELSSDEVVEDVGGSVPVRYICQRLRQLNEVIGEESSTRDFWLDPVFPVFQIHPVLYECLCFPRASIYDDVQLRRRECFRLAAILYICNLRAKFDPEPGQGMLYGTKLQAMLSSLETFSLWPRSNTVLLWTLTVASCSATLFDDLREQFVALLAFTTRALGIRTFGGFHARVHGLTWSDAAFGPELYALRDRLELDQ